MWSEEEYNTLRGYDRPTFAQPVTLWLCHHHDRNSPRRQVCAGWAGCHDGATLLAVRVALATGLLSVANARAVETYTSPVPLFASGAQAAEHGLADLDTPSLDAVQAIAKFDRRRATLNRQGEASGNTPTLEAVRAIAELNRRLAALVQSQAAGSTPRADEPGIPPSRAGPSRIMTAARTKPRTTPRLQDTAHWRHPDDFDVADWQRHAGDLLDTWLREEFTWAGRPLALFLAEVSAVFDDGHRLALWQAAGPPPAFRPRAPRSALLLDGAEYDMFHPVWVELMEAPWLLEGRLLHPHTRLEIDQHAFAHNGANLLIAVPDRRTPDVAPRLDPDTSPYTTDQGVLTVPLWPFRALSAMRAGADAATALLLLAGTAVADFAVHEALETYQGVSGRPVWDPHDSPHELTIEARRRDRGEDRVRLRPGGVAEFAAPGVGGLEPKDGAGLLDR